MSHLNEDQVEEVIQIAYQTMLGRNVDLDALEYYKKAISSGELAPADLYANISATDEYLSKICRDRKYHIVRKDHSDAFEMSELESDERYEKIDIDAFPVDRFNELFDQARSRHERQDVRDYCNLHGVRFRELFGIVSQLCDPGDRVVEISTSPASYGLVEATGVHYVSVDHPSMYGEFNGIENPELRSHRHVSVDMNYDDPWEKISAFEEEKFDLVIFCEIIEHLLISPYDQVRKLANCLKPGGFLFISTPNFFSHERQRRMRNRKHPLDLIPPGDTFIHGAHHVREYTMDDLFKIVSANGLSIHHYSWSKCWDVPPVAEPWLENWVDRHPQDRTNLYLVAQKPA